MKRRLAIITIILLTAVITFAPSYSPAAEFSADVENYMNSRPVQSITGKAYVKGNKYRMDMYQGGTLVGITIGDMDKGVVYNLNPADKTYMEMNSQGQDMMASMDETIKDMADVIELGTEKVNGYSCRKVEYRYKDKKLGKAYNWISTKLNYPIKFELVNDGQTTMRNEYTNIKEGSQPGSLFEIPAGYNKFRIPGLPAGIKIPGLR